MGITDELRKWAEDNTLQDTVITTYPPQHAVHGVLETLLRIADRIDAEHKKAIHELNGLAEVSVLLPKDADGVPIRVGDKVDSDHYEDGTVTGIQFYEMTNGGIRTLITVRPDGWGVPMLHTPDEYRHHHAPTVEDVLRKFAYGLGVSVADSYVAATAAKLRLAEGEDE